MKSPLTANRRAFLRGTGALCAVPWLAPALSDFTPGASAAAPATAPASTDATRQLRADLAARQHAVNARDRAEWAQLRSLADWERFVAPRIAALRRSLGSFPTPPEKLPVHVTRTISGAGFRIENLVYESRPGVFVTANLYLPAPPSAAAPASIAAPAKLPALVIIHSHHNAKTQSELQDMGMTWARAGCAVLVPDQAGYGERRDHPPGARQDYRFRYYNALQLHTLGDSLMGWMVWDTSRGLDALLQRANIDREKIILLGSVAGGGDPAAVVGALDRRFTCVAPFNFGGPQPETRFPLPDDAAATFDYLGGGSWESTRNLLRSGSDGFLPWVIVASLAPRRLIYGHEFSWDRERDPVWRRLEQVFAWHGVPENLAFTHGHGRLSGRPPEASHCNNIGVPHRQRIHAALEKWFGIRATEYSQPLPAADLLCFTPELRERLRPRPAHEIYSELGAARVAALRAKLAPLPPPAQRALLQTEWAKLLGNVTPSKPTAVGPAPAWVKPADLENPGTSRAERVVLEVEPGLAVPLLLLLPAGTRAPLVIALAQHGHAKFLSDRKVALTELLARGIAVCLPEVRGTGASSPEGSREMRSEATSLSATELMLGGTLLGARLRDLRSVLAHLRTRADVNTARVALWGDSFAPVNPPGFTEPLIGEGRSPHASEPLGGLLALFGALFEDDVRAVVARGIFPGFQSLLRAPFCHAPHDAIIPGALTAGDLLDLAAALAPRPVHLESLVDGRNLALTATAARTAFASVTASSPGAAATWQITEPTPDRALAAWLAQALK
ncbi:hypothetical protein LBMAG56_25500 [Verrucomicrobiota bacterium]|nr:hypothetical protein LBMAG56_25500 [Verrucomicrobiota bacterium]